MEVRRCQKDEILIYNEELLKGIYLVRSGVINVKVRVALFEDYIIQELYPRCSYGTYAFFAKNNSINKKSRFTLQAAKPCEYFFISYDLLDRLSRTDKSMSKIMKHYRKRIDERGFPWCDFKIFHKSRILSELFTQCLRRLIIIGK